MEARALVCPGCGGSVQLRGMTQTASAVCIQCLSIIDTTTPELRIIQQFMAAQRTLPLIPLGTRGKLRGDLYEAIGFQTRQIEVDGMAYEWREYVLFNPYKGFRYLSEYDGHWNDILPIKGLPIPTSGGVSYLNESYKHFQTATAETTYVMGEFPWKVMVGEKADCTDYVSPPRMLSSEKSGNEITWSIGEYMTGAQIAEAFQLKTALPDARGIYANQPSPFGNSVGSSWTLAVFLIAALAGVMVLSSMFMSQKEVFRQKYSFFPRTGVENSFVTSVFPLEGRTTNVELSVNTSLLNQWLYFNFALINDDTGEAYDFGREVSYYNGRDSDGAWSEGSASDTVLIPSIPPGRYYLRVEPEVDAASISSARGVNYEIVLRRDVPFNIPFGIAALLLLIPPVFTTLRKTRFEQARWQESDHAPAASDDDDSDSGDDD